MSTPFDIMTDYLLTTTCIFILLHSINFVDRLKVSRRNLVSTIITKALDLQYNLISNGFNTKIDSNVPHGHQLCCPEIVFIQRSWLPFTKPKEQATFPEKETNFPSTNPL